MRTHSLLLPPTFAVLLAASAAAQLAVVNASAANAAPSLNNARGVSPAAALTLTFSAPVDPTTITAQNVQVAGRWSGPVPGVLSIGAGGTTVTFTPLRPLFPTEIGTLLVSHFVTSNTGSPLNGGFMANWWVDSAPSTGTFVQDQIVDYRLPGEGTIRTYGFFAGDVDRDGSPDMTATNEVSNDIRRLLNDGCGTYGASTIIALPAGEEPSPNEGADFNGDGWIDLATGNQNGQSVSIFLNDAAGSYLPPVVIGVGGNVHGLALLDADSDGHVDVLATNSSFLVLLRGNGDGTFQPPVFFDGGGAGERSVAVADANGDGKPDIFCGTAQTQVVTILLGDGNGNFTISASRACGGLPWQMAVGDLDGDGDTDCVVANNGSSNAGVLFGNGAGGLSPVVTYGTGSSPVSVDIGDVEGDDDLDIVVANFGSGNATMLRNNGSGVFGGATTLPAALAGSCAVIVDYDRDGDTDVIVVDELADRGFVYRQLGPNVPGAQPPGCDAALRVNGFAHRAGFGGTPPQFLAGGSLAFFEVSGGPGQLAALFAGTPYQAGFASPFGLLNLDLAQPLDLLVSGFSGDPLGVLNGFGETRLPVLVPNTLPPGTTFTVQCLVSTPAGLVVSNPQQVVF
ncbi:MAG TPA: FG-GAP-like repeat-containing protein [Planctomycetota bacterium]|nr:FG-GAP-like repeat-containing protein [Planctomycetota bacterium]